MIQSIIDRIYVPTHIEDIGGTIEILPTLPDISDHASVVLHFVDEPKRKPTVPRFNKGLLANSENKALILDTWKRVIGDENHSTWNHKMVAANIAIRLKSMELTKIQKKTWKETYQAQFDDIKAAEAELQQNWGSREARNHLSDAQATIHEVRQQKFQFQESAILSKWARAGDRCTKEFFEHHEGTRKPTTIATMKDGEQTLTSQSKIETHILQFYENLYMRDERVESNDEARTECLNLIKQTVLPEHNEELTRPLTMKEVKEAMQQLPKGKAPGTYTIPAEFYQKFREDIAPDILNFVSETFTQAHISEDLNVSKIALLLKTKGILRIQNF